MDENGTVVLGSAFAERPDPDEQVWTHPNDAGGGVRVLGLTTDGPRQYVLEAKQRWGDDQYRYYDATTMLLARETTFARDRHKYVDEYDDYRAAFGQTRAYHVRSSEDASNAGADYWITSLARDQSTQPLFVPRSRPLFQLPSSAPIVLPARFTEAGIVVRATIANRGLDFLLDSGSSRLTIDPGVAHDLGLTPYGHQRQTLGADVDVSRAQIPNVHIGPLSLEDTTFDVLPMPFETGDTRIVGLLGCDFLAATIVGIDFAHQTVTLYPRSAFDPNAVGATAQSRMDTITCVPRIPAAVEGVQGAFLVDTGATTTMVYGRFLDQLATKHYDSGSPDVLSEIYAVGGAVKTSVYEIADVDFGPIRFKSVRAVVPIDSTLDDDTIDGVFGRNILLKCTIYLDYADNLIFFKPEVR
jgi:predicted aspartyl protease